MKSFFVRLLLVAGLLWLGTLIGNVADNAVVLAGPAAGTSWTAICPPGSATQLTCNLFRTPFNIIQAWTVATADIADYAVTGIKMNLATPPSGAYEYGRAGLSNTAVSKLCAGKTSADSTCTARTDDVGDIYAYADLVCDSEMAAGNSVCAGHTTAECAAHEGAPGAATNNGFYGAGPLAVDGAATIGGSTTLGDSAADSTTIYGSTYPQAVSVDTTSATAPPAGTLYVEKTLTAASGIRSGGTSGDCAGGSCDPKLKWKRFTASSSASVSITTSLATIVGATCSIKDSVSGYSYTFNGSATVGVTVYWDNTAAGTIVVVPGSSLQDAADKVLCLVWYE